MSKRVALFAGSFDPFTRGHEDIVLRGLGIVEYDLQRLAALVSPVETGKWKKWGCESLLAEIETQADCAIEEFFSQALSRSEVTISSK